MPPVTSDPEESSVNALVPVLSVKGKKNKQHMDFHMQMHTWILKNNTIR